MSTHVSVVGMLLLAILVIGLDDPFDVAINRFFEHLFQ